MERQVKISVIMGVYNPVRERLIRAVESVIGQTMTEWEMLICDDGSDLPGREIIRETADMDGRIRCIENDKNMGLAYALNQCLKHSKGKYIARLDDDDESMPDRFRRQYEFLETHPEYGWTGSGAQLFDDNGVWGSRSMPETPDREDFLKSSPYIHPSVMFRREVLGKSRGYLPMEITRRCEDYELFMRLHMMGYKGYNMRENLIRYREDENAYRKRTLHFRMNEMKIRYRGFQRMKILRPAKAMCVLRPLAGAVVPVTILKHMKKREKGVSTEQYGGNRERVDRGLQKIQAERGRS